MSGDRFAGRFGHFNWFWRPQQLGLIALLWLCTNTTAHSEDAQTNQNLKRSLSEHLFLGAQLGLSHRQAVYASDALQAGDSSDEFRIRVSGAAQKMGPLGAYFGLSLAGRPFIDPNENTGSAFADPYDELSLQKNVRLHSAYIEYTAKDLDKATKLKFRAGRLAQLDQNGILLLCDGISVDYVASHSLMISSFGGARARLDDSSEFKDRTLARQVCAGASTQWRRKSWGLRTRYHYEQIHRASLDGTYSNDNLDLLLGAEILVSPSEESTSPAVIIRHDGHWLSDDQRWSSQWLVLGQLGTDPRTYGRADFSLTPEVMGKIHANRLYLGAVDPHLRAHGDTQYWLTSWLALQGGAFTRIILTEEDKDSIRPQVSEIWLGPEIATAKGIRMGLETELGFESAGPENLFANTGDAVSRRLGLRAYSEIPFKLASELSVALRPSFLASWTNTDSALSSTENQARYSGGLIAILNWDQRAKFGARYEAEILPELGSSGTQSVHRSELWIEGTY